MFSTAPGRLITTIINNSGAAWNGAITANIPGAVTAVREYTADTDGRLRARRVERDGQRKRSGLRSAHLRDRVCAGPARAGRGVLIHRGAR